TTGLLPRVLSTRLYDPFDPRLPSPLGATASALSWTDTRYQQWRRDAAGFRVLTRSALEPDAEAALPELLLEDQLFTQIRLDPSALPVGLRSLVPGLHFLTLEHLPLRGYTARLSRGPGLEEGTERLS